MTLDVRFTYTAFLISIIWIVMVRQSENLRYRINGLVQVDYRSSDAISLSAIKSTHSSLLHPALHSQIDGKSLREPLVGVTALIDLQPVGLILCELDDCGKARIVCWNVLPHYREKGIGSRLLSHLEQMLSANEIGMLTHLTRSDLPSFKIVEATLIPRGWSCSERLRLYKVTKSNYKEPVWFDQVTLRQGYSLFPWNKLRSTERAQIVAKQNAGNWFPGELTPFQEESTIEWSNSIGLRFQGEVVGWMITHRVATDVVQYTALFVAEEHRSQATGIALIADSVKRHLAVGGSRAIFQVRSDNTPFIRFVDRRFNSILSSTAKRMLFKKEL
ncbi:MAG: GNAT family N-acetyltransferase [Candidatus Thiodiazotropha taylori]|nr:GNAT family N-acetyltransferase [Candidatus Thiodiazotropha taylori]MCG7997682.1 GNAT family N-acetyltransferase [Candidatus Thiodiazotropha taylori]